MEDIELLIDLHRGGLRLGPGGDPETRLAISLSGLTHAQHCRIADIGCGTGAATLTLAGALNAHITAVDFVPEFLTDLQERAARAGVADSITTLSASMEAMPFEKSSFDAIWSEGAIYNMGFAAGIQAWREYLKPNGIIAVSDLTWLTETRPAALQTHWERGYPEVDTAAAKFAILERLGFSPIGYFTLPEHCWLANYYRPLQQRFAGFLDRHGHSQEARALITAEEREIELYETYKAFFSYGFFIARKVDPGATR